jgi:hypothetical protein
MSSFTADTAKKTHKSRRTIERQAKIGAALSRPVQPLSRGALAPQFRRISPRLENALPNVARMPVFSEILSEAVFEGEWDSIRLADATGPRRVCVAPRVRARLSWFLSWFVCEKEK